MTKHPDYVLLPRAPDDTTLDHDDHAGNAGKFDWLSLSFRPSGTCDVSAATPDPERLAQRLEALIELIRREPEVMQAISRGRVRIRWQDQIVA